MEDTDASQRDMWETSDSEGDDSKSCAKSESLSDIDDIEVNTYLNSDKEKELKNIIWEKLNRQYLQEQELKKSAAAGNAAKPKKERQKQTTRVKKTQCNAQVADPTSSKRRSSRLNYDALSKILDESASPSDGPKRRKIESDSDPNSGEHLTKNQLVDDEPSAAGESEEENGWEDPEDYPYYGNQEEEYNGYDDDELY